MKSGFFVHSERLV